jgi:hypothetical protein
VRPLVCFFSHALTIHRSHHKLEHRDRSASPMHWTPRYALYYTPVPSLIHKTFSPPPAKSSKSKGKRRAVSVEEETLPVPVVPTKKSSSSKIGTSSSARPQPAQPTKLNSFETALAAKGITLETALARAGTGSPSKEQYMADLNGYRVPCVILSLLELH